MGIIQKMAQNQKDFVQNPGKDFTRKRKLDFATMMTLLLSMNGGSISSELMKFFGFDSNIVSSSAFVQQRKKIQLQAFDHLLNELVKTQRDLKSYRGYRLLAIDGTQLSIPYNPKDINSLKSNIENSKGSNILSISTLYDLENRLYLDGHIVGIKSLNEKAACKEIIDRCQVLEPTILIADRGYEGYNLLCNLIDKGWKFVIRIKDKQSNGIISKVDLPETEEYDEKVQWDLTHLESKTLREQLPHFRRVHPHYKLDILKKYDLNFYTLKARVVRIKVNDGLFETLVTNLDANEFSSDELKKLYSKRWGIETSFRELKYALGLNSVHSKERTCVAQEIFSKLIMYNYCEMVTSHIIISKKDTLHLYKVNFTMAVLICKHYMSCKGTTSPPEVENLIQKHILPIRPDRHFPRRNSKHTAISFLYRIS